MLQMPEANESPLASGCLPHSFYVCIKTVLYQWLEGVC
jgi:hypothetical protein